MSYTSEVKAELAGHISKARHCRIAEISAIISMCGNILISADDKYTIKIFSENASVVSAFGELIKKTFDIEYEASVKVSNKKKRIRTYTLVIKNNEDSRNILLATKLMDRYGNIEENMSISDNIIIQKDCCKRAFVRGAFLSTGTVMSPDKSYHLEIVCNGEEKAGQIVNILKYFNIDGKVIARKAYNVVYIKEGEQIVDVLNVMEAHVALLKYENVRILKDMSNNINRQNNCEIANIKRTVTSAHRQIEAIRFIDEMIGIDELPANLREIAAIRLNNPDVPLKELGELMDPPVGKSGVNHRLRRICEIAQELRDN